MGILSPLRNGRVTASSIGAILGVNPYQSADDTMRTMVRAYHNKGAGDAGNYPSEFTGNAATEHGHQMEPVAINAYELEYDLDVIQDPDFVVHPTVDWLGCTPDGYISMDGMLEVKCPFYARKCYTLGEKLMYKYQVYLQLICTGRAWCDFYVWMENEQHCERVWFIDAVDWFTDNYAEIETFYNLYLKTINDDKLSAPYLEDKEVDLSENPRWILAARAKEVSRQNLADAKLADDANRSELIAIAKSHGKKCTGSGVMVCRSVRKGSVDYTKVPELEDINLDDYRKKDTVIWSVRYGQ